MSHYLGIITAEVITKFSPGTENSLFYFSLVEKWPSCVVPNLTEQFELKSNVRKFHLKKTVLKGELYMETDIDLILLLDAVIKYFISLSGMEGRWIFN